MVSGGHNALPASKYHTLTAVYRKEQCSNISHVTTREKNHVKTSPIGTNETCHIINSGLGTVTAISECIYHVR